MRNPNGHDPKAKRGLDKEFLFGCCQRRLQAVAAVGGDAMFAGMAIDPVQKTLLLEPVRNWVQVNRPLRMAWILLLAATLSPVAGCAPEWQKNPAAGAGVRVRFSHGGGDAKSVCVAGSFNQWSPTSHCMRRIGSAWVLDLNLPSGRYEYLLVLDGERWHPDPRAAISTDSGFGTRNSVLIVE